MKGKERKLVLRFEIVQQKSEKCYLLSLALRKQPFEKNASLLVRSEVEIKV